MTPNQTPNPNPPAKSHVLHSICFGDTYMIFTISPTKPEFGVLTYLHVDNNGHDREAKDPFTIYMTTNALSGMSFMSSKVYPVEILRRIWNELLTDDRADGWKEHQGTNEVIDFYSDKANVIIRNFDEEIDGRNSVFIPRRSRRSPFVPTPELVEDMKAAGQDPLDFVSFA